MKLIDFISVTSADEVVQIRNDEHSLYIGTVRNVYDVFSEKRMKAAKVIYIFTGFSGIIVDITE